MVSTTPLVSVPTGAAKPTSSKLSTPSAVTSVTVMDGDITHVAGVTSAVLLIQSNNGAI